MHGSILLALLFVAAPAMAAEWVRFDNSRFGYAVDVPPGFVQAGQAPANDDGLRFASGNGTQRLTVWGGQIIEDSFESAVYASIGLAADDGWSIGYERVTPSWASFSGLRNGMVLYARAIALCGGQQYAAFELEYPERDLKAMSPVIERLVGSLKPSGAGAGC